MKNWKKIFLGIIGVLLLPQIVSADVLTCDNESYNVSKVGTTVINFASESYNLNYYKTAGYASTYCLDPGGAFKSAASSYSCKELIDPTGESSGIGSLKHARDVAYSYAYAQLVEKGLVGDDEKSHVVGELVYRWITFNYELGSRKATLSTAQRYISYFAMNQGGTIPYIWDTVQSESIKAMVEEAKKIYYDSVAVGNLVYFEHKTYEEIKDLLPDVNLTYTSTTENLGNGRTAHTITFNNPADTTVWWDDFTFTVNGSDARVENVEHASGSSSYRVIVYSPTGSNYTLSADARYYSKNVAYTAMKILKNNRSSSTYQDMLVVARNADEAKKTVHTGKKVQLNGDCIEDNNEWYICKDTTSYDPDKCEPDTGGVCDKTPEKPTGKTCSFENGTYYGKDGSVVTSLIFYHECCEIPGMLTPEEYNLWCPCGDPDIDFIGNCSEFNSDSEIINTVKDTKENADLKTCLFNLSSVDAAGNSVSMTDQQQTVINNPYCKVSCIEEYEFTLPNAKYTTSGGYFNLSSEVSGKRTCYVNASDEGKYTGIDYEKFSVDLENARKAVIDAYNEYIYYKNGAAAETRHSGPNSCSHSPHGKAPNHCSTNCSATGDVVTKDWTFVMYDYNGNSSGNVSRFTAPNGKVYNGTYSDGEDSSCGHGGCSGRVGTDPTSDYESKRDTALNTLNQRIAAYNVILQNYNNCSGVITTTTENAINFPGVTSVSWENNFNYNPILEFEYEEPYQNLKDFNGTFEQISNNGMSGSKDNYCVNAVGDTYDCDGASSVTYNSTPQFICTENGCATVSFNIGSSKFVTKEKTQTETFAPQNNFSVYTPIGTIVLDKEDGLYKVLCKEKDCLPVALNTPTGVFNFNFKFAKIGQYNDNNENGRLMGGNNNIFDAVNIDAGYVCQYINNCPECDYVCVGDSCEIEADPDCPDCPFVCQNCIFDGNNMTYAYRTVSINNLFPTERSLKTNWSNEKGEYTAKIIEEAGEEAYKELQYSYTITANQMRNIRIYNQSVNGYLNTQTPNGDDALICDDRDGYQNIICISVFLEENKNNRKYFTENKRNGEWTLWPDSGYYEDSTKYVYRDGLGPVWK